MVQTSLPSLHAVLRRVALGLALVLAVLVAPSAPATASDPTIVLSGVISPGDGGMSDATITVLDSAGIEVASVDTASSAWSVDVVPGVYSVQAHGRIDFLYFLTTTALREFVQDASLDMYPVLHPVTVHLFAADGSPAPGEVNLRCLAVGTFDEETVQDVTTWFPVTGSGDVVAEIVEADASATGTITVLGPPTPEGSHCKLAVSTDGVILPVVRDVSILPDDSTAVTIINAGTLLVLDGDPTTTLLDEDGIADAVEALAPNNGDGNHDGTPDYQQPHVTSLPGLGGQVGDGNPYLTLVAPVGSALVDVATLDPAMVATAPPPGTTLPAGLASFVLDGVETGSTRTISIYTAATAQVTGYAKYDPVTGAWSMLPSENVHVYADRVDIDLTDGGPGDADGIANGRIVDPGGLAIVADTPPLVGWTLSGFSAPVDMGIRNTVKGGSTVPLKFQVRQGSTELTDPATTVQSFTTSRIPCTEGAVEDAIEATTFEVTNLRYDIDEGQFIQHWKTPRAPNTCHQVTLTTRDASQLIATFRIK